MNIVKCLKEFFLPASTEPVGLCSFEDTKHVKKAVIKKPSQRKEMRLSELME